MAKAEKISEKTHHHRRDYFLLRVSRPFERSQYHGIVIYQFILNEEKKPKVFNVMLIPF